MSKSSKTLPQIAKEIGMPATTLRYRVSHFKEFIPFHKSRNYIYYNKKSEAIIREINESFVQGLETSDIYIILTEKYTKEFASDGEQVPQIPNKNENEIVTGGQIKNIIDERNSTEINKKNYSRLVSTIWYLFKCSECGQYFIKAYPNGHMTCNACDHTMKHPTCLGNVWGVPELKAFV